MRGSRTKGLLLSGLARNSRLRDLLDDKFARVRELAVLCGGVARGF